MGYPGELPVDILEMYVTYTLGIEPVATKFTLA